MPHGKSLKIPSNGPIITLDPRSERMFVVYLKETADSEYTVSIRPFDPLRQLVGVNREALPEVRGFTEKRYSDLHDLESGREEGALNVSDAHRVTMTEETWREPTEDAILVAEFAGEGLSLGVPGAAEFLLVEDVAAWENPRRTAEVLAAAAKDQNAMLQRVQQDGAIFYRLGAAAVGRIFAFAAHMPQGLPVAGVLKVTRVSPDEQTIRIEHRFVPTDVARQILRNG